MFKFIRNNRMNGKSDLILRLAMTVLLAAITAVATIQLLSCSVKTVRIWDGDKVYSLKTLCNDVTDMVKTVNLSSDHYRIIETKQHGKTTEISIEYTFPVYITSGNQTVTLETGVATVGEILTSAGFVLDQNDLVEPSVDTEITQTAYIDYTDISFVSGTYTEAIPCSTDIIYSENYTVGTKTTQAGTEGVRLVSYTSKIVNGVTVETNIDNTQVLSDAVNHTQIIGTKALPVEAVATSSSVPCVSTLTPAAPIELDANGNPIHFTKKMTVQATAYTYTGHRCSTGVAPQPGYIAVNPRIIPYGTKLYIKTPDGKYVYGYAVAADTGGFIKSRPTNVDLFLTSEAACQQFGRRNVEIYVLE
ncbi:MAG: G5 domain-containing protein [Clostridia bacterium]|nr:G5 domain-containing protein [Clostridia bacterium]